MPPNCALTKLFDERGSLEDPLKAKLKAMPSEQELAEARRCDGLMYGYMRLRPHTPRNQT